jgi:hypothetical protein
MLRGSKYSILIVIMLGNIFPTRSSNKWFGACLNLRLYNDRVFLGFLSIIIVITKIKCYRGINSSGGSSSWGFGWLLFDIIKINIVMLN